MNVTLHGPGYEGGTELAVDPVPVIDQLRDLYRAVVAAERAADDGDHGEAAERAFDDAVVDFASCAEDHGMDMEQALAFMSGSVE